MVLASIYGTAFIVLGSLLALWSLWWIIQAARTNPGEREAEDDARARIARGEGWTEGTPAPTSFSDADIVELSEALAPSTPEEAGVEARPRPRRSSGRSNKR